MGTAKLGPGALLAGRYELLKAIGRGGQGEAWIARDRARDPRRVVLKIRSVADAGDRATVVSEARILLDLPPHPRIPTVRDDFFDGDQYCLVMDWVEGRSLAQILAEDGAPGLPFERVASWVVQVADALDHLHRHSPPVFHQDVKPQNIVVTSDDRAVLVDFALASSEDPGRHPRGTPPYIAPEIGGGGSPSVASDVYSLGVTAHTLLSGTPPEPGSASDLSTVPGDRRAIVRDTLWRALAIEPEGRPHSAGEFAGAFRQSGPVGSAFVGRRAELAALTTGLARALDGRGSSLLVTGEGGIGKTALLTVFARGAAAAGARVCWGRCWEGTSSPVFLPWTQIVTSLLRHVPVSVVDELGPLAGYLAKLVPDVLPGPDDGYDDAARLFESVVAYLKHSARDRPLVLLLDDVHMSDRSSVELLRYVWDSIDGHAIALVVACRAREARGRADLARFVDGRAADGHTIALDGLEGDDIRRSVFDGLGISLSDADVAALVDTTRGNPFFVNELVRLTSYEGGDARTTVPENVREAVRRRLDHLPDDVRAMLRAAAVAGRAFDLESMITATGSDTPTLIGQVDRARRHGVLRDDSDSGGFLFAHDVFRESIYEDVDPVVRARLHLDFGRALEASHRSTEDPGTLAALAHHYERAVQAGAGERAVHFMHLAGLRAFRQLAYQDAISTLERATALITSGDAPKDDAARCAILIDLSAAELAAGRPSADETLAEATDLARELRDGVLIARAALCRPVPFGRVIEGRRVLFEEAFALLGSSPSVERAGILSGLGLMLSFTSERERGLDMLEEAIRVGEQLDHRFTVETSRTNLVFARSGPDHLEDRLRAFSSLSDQVRAQRADPFIFQRQIEVAALLEAADRDGLERAYAELESDASVHSDTYSAWGLGVFRAMRAILDGAFDQADVLVEDAMRLGTEAQAEAALINYGGQLAILRREQGRIAEIEPLLVAFVEQFPELVAVRAAVAVLMVELGRLDDARERFDAIAREGFGSIPTDSTWLCALELLAEASAALGDADRARELIVLLEPYHDRIPTAAGAVAQPPVAFALGLLYRTTGDAVSAEQHFGHALEVAQRMRSHPWEPRIRFEWARAVAERDPARALGLVIAARTDADALGMRKLAADVAVLELELSSAAKDRTVSSG